ncbi:hypothetical protein GQX73_g5849 [Xylaria multiplex]|uniref:DASH complex subunit SPC19 n=1 Tax=Xylaria multiplex TaxID=323545 RepID=A0A7C8N3W1_9PEZI|nr:hypothetical protein GQX73_g5849 [Xylaria multiplex]
MFSDPYTYQYSAIEPEHDTPATSSSQQWVAASNSPSELEGSTPTHTALYELAANPLIESAPDSYISDEPATSCGLSRSRLSGAQRSVRYPSRRGHTRQPSVRVAPETNIPRSCPPQPSNAGLIPVLEHAPIPAHHYVQETAPRQYARPSPPAYADGLIPVDDNATTPKEPSSDFDAILRNIGPISKKGKDKTGRERSSRYYDRYTSNFAPKRSTSPQQLIPAPRTMAASLGFTSTNTASYSDCVAALRTSLSFLESSVTTLESGVSDFPRLINVLKTARHYELIPQTTLQTAEASLRSELAPAITTLLDRADAHIDRVDRRIESLRARAELQQGRLDNSPSRPAKAKPGGSQLDGSAKLRARVLKQRREALQYSVERLELEVLQKERELRKRLDVT